MAVTWLWEIRSRDGRILRKDTYLARPYASPQDIADERMALLVHVLLGDGRKVTDLAGLVCRAWRADDPDVWGESTGDDWISAAAPALS